MKLDYDKLRERLRLLRGAKPSTKLLGHDAHGFQTNPPLAEAAVKDFEDRHHVLLPADYREFLIRLGNGGAGPGYGLFELGEMDNAFKHKRWKEDDGFVGTLAAPFPHQSAWNDRAGEPEYDESRENDEQWEEDFERRMAAWEQQYWNSANVNGAIPICHLGCAYRQWLVVTGPEAGTIWDDDRANLSGLKPLQQNGRGRVTFSEWYSDWLEEATASCGL